MLCWRAPPVCRIEGGVLGLVLVLPKTTLTPAEFATQVSTLNQTKFPTHLSTLHS
jgi:hypothetical protein